MQSQYDAIFVSIKINECLRDQLDSSKASMKLFFEDDNPEYLQIIHIDDDEYIGKVTASGASFEELNNMRMNVKTMLKMICPKFSFADDAIKIMAVSRFASRSFYYGRG